MSLEAFVDGLHSSLEKISKLELNDELKGHLFLKQGNLDTTTIWFWERLKVTILSKH